MLASLLREMVQSKTNYHTALLSRRVRNTSLIGNSVPADVREYSRYGEDFNTATVVIPVITSTHTLPGYRPAAALTDLGDYR